MIRCARRSVLQGASVPVGAAPHGRRSAPRRTGCGTHYEMSELSHARIRTAQRRNRVVETQRQADTPPRRLSSAVRGSRPPGRATGAWWHQRPAARCAWLRSAARRRRWPTDTCVGRPNRQDHPGRQARSSAILSGSMKRATIKRCSKHMRAMRWRAVRTAAIKPCPKSHHQDRSAARLCPAPLPPQSPGPLHPPRPPLPPPPLPSAPPQSLPSLEAAAARTLRSRRPALRQRNAAAAMRAGHRQRRRRPLPRQAQGRAPPRRLPRSESSWQSTAATPGGANRSRRRMARAGGGVHSGRPNGRRR